MAACDWPMTGAAILSIAAGGSPSAVTTKTGTRSEALTGSSAPETDETIRILETEFGVQ
jgi:hypothetical protein